MGDTVKRQLLFVVGVMGCVAACGGSVVFEEDGAGGSGGTASSSKSGSQSGSKSVSGSKVSSNVSATQTNTATTDVGTTSGGCSLPDPSLPASCQDACSDLYDCGMLFCDGEPQCPAFFPGGKASFMMFCVPQCMQQPALISIVDPSSCDVTVQTVKSISFEFADQCEGVFKDG